MITICRGWQRRLVRGGKQETWQTFFAQAPDVAPPRGLTTLEALDEARLPPGARRPSASAHGAEIVTYVRDGALAYEDTMGRSGVVQTGEFLRRTPAGCLRHSESNASRTQWALVFRISLGCALGGLDHTLEQKRFSAAERRDRLCVVASPDGRQGSLQLQGDALACSALIGAGQHLVHELAKGRSAWLHLVSGAIAVGDLLLAAGDGVGVTEERAVSMIAQEASEILLVEVGAKPPPAPNSRGVS